MMKCDAQRQIVSRRQIWHLWGEGGSLRISMQASMITKKANPIVVNVIARWR
jgi:hypothetical protein